MNLDERVVNIKKPEYLYHIDSLRALAVILVVLFHLDVAFFKGGFVGVDMFFVISGFLITRIIKYEFETTRTFQFKRFYLKRARRLLPTLFLTLLLSFVFAFLIFSPSDFVNMVSSMFRASIAISNFFFLGEVNYFDEEAYFKPLLHTWSLGIEEQFYLIWPVTIFLLLKLFSKKKVPLFIISILLLSFLGTVYFSKYGIPIKILNYLPVNKEELSIPSIQFYLLPFRVFEFLIGAILVFIPKIKIKNEILKIVLSTIGFSLIILSATLFEKTTPGLSVYNIIPCIGIALLIILPQSRYLSFFFKNRVLKFIGDTSYTIYLIHWPVIVFYKYLVSVELTITSQILLSVIYLSLSALIYKFYEAPLRYGKVKFSIKSKKSFVYISIVCILCFYALSRNVNSQEGWYWRMDDKVLEQLKLHNQKDSINNIYENWLWGGNDYSNGIIKNTEKKSSTIEINWFGDSHSMQYAYGLDSIMVKKHDKSVNLFRHPSVLLPNIESRDASKEVTEKYLDMLVDISKNNPKSIHVINYHWLYRIGLCKYSENGKLTKLERKEKDFNIIANQIEKLHKRLGENRKLIIIGSSPVREDDVNYIDKILRPKYLSNFFPTDSKFKSKNKLVEMNAFFEEYFKNKPNMFFINPHDALCNGDNMCLSQKGSEIYYSDANHLSKYGSLEVIKYFEEELLKVIGNN